MPKALVPVAGKPLLEHIIVKLKNSGFDEIIINIHHFAGQIIDFLKVNNNFGIRIEISDESDLLLDTGGGIRKAAAFFNDGKPFLVHNVDILSNIDLRKFYSAHLKNSVLATLAVSSRISTRYLLFDKNMRLQGWKNVKTGETRPEGKIFTENHIPLAFSGIQVLSPEILGLMENCASKFSIIDFYLQNLGEKIVGFVPDNFKMIDAGKPETLEQAHMMV
jgi:NDP-sugar pyrophosphorylase family protein